MESIIKNNKKNETHLEEVRCEVCKRLLGKFSGYAEIKCPKCGKVNIINKM